MERYRPNGPTATQRLLLAMAAASMPEPWPPIMQRRPAEPFFKEMTEEQVQQFNKGATIKVGSYIDAFNRKTRSLAERKERRRKRKQKGKR